MSTSFHFELQLPYKSDQNSFKISIKIVILVDEK